MEKIYIVFIERTDYTGNKCNGVHETNMDKFFLRKEDAAKEIAQNIANLAAIYKESATPELRRIIIEEKNFTIVYRYRIEELIKA